MSDVIHITIEAPRQEEGALSFGCCEWRWWTQDGAMTSRVMADFLRSPGKDDDALCKDPKARASFRNFLMVCLRIGYFDIFCAIPNSNRLWRLSVCSVWKLMKRGLPHWKTTAVDSSPSSLLLSNHERVVIRGMCYGQFLKNAILMFCPCS